MKLSLVKPESTSPAPATSHIQTFAFAVLILLLMGFSAANAQSIVINGEPTASGSGCPPGSVAAVVASDGSAISLLFSDFVLTRPAKVYAQAYRGCSFNIPISVPAGYVLQATRIDYRGFAVVPQYGFVQITTSNLNGVPRVGRPTQVSNYIKNYADNFTISQFSTQAWSDKCMRQPAIQFTTAIIAGGSKNPKFRIPMDEDVMVGLDSADIGDSPVTIGIKLVRCR
jgi:hypothetical protein